MSSINFFSLFVFFFLGEYREKPIKLVVIRRIAPIKLDFFNHRGDSYISSVHQGKTNHQPNIESITDVRVRVCLIVQEVKKIELGKTVI